MKYKILWDNGGCDSGVFPEEYDTPEDAKQAGENWKAEMGSEYEFDIVEQNQDDESPEDFDPRRDGWVGHDGRP